MATKMCDRMRTLERPKGFISCWIMVPLTYWPCFVSSGSLPPAIMLRRLSEVIYVVELNGDMLAVGQTWDCS